MNCYTHKKTGMFFCIVVLLTAVTVSSLYAASLSLKEVIQKIQVRYDQTEDLTAEFVQKATIKSVGQTVIESGTVYFKKPKRMLWDYREPSHKKLVINPQKAWLYMPEDHLVYVQDSQKILSSKMTVRFMAGMGKLQDDFQISFSDNAVDETGNYRLRLIPHRKEMGIEHLTMKVNAKTFFIMNFSFTDIYGNTTELTFGNMKANHNLSDSLFDFTPPPDVEVYEVP